MASGTATTEDEQRWLDLAAAYPVGRSTGIPLEEFDPDADDMTPLYEALRVDNVFERKMLHKFIRRLRREKQQQQQQQPIIKIDDEVLSRGLKRALADCEYFSRPTPNRTPASFGYATLEQLKKFDLIQDISGFSGEPILTEEQSKTLSSLANEHHVVSYLTPFLERAIDTITDIHVVNSEAYPWLKTSSLSRFNQKPDNIFCSSAVYSRRPPYKSNDETLLQIRCESDKFGVLTDWRLRDCVDAIGEAKLKISPEALGETVNYARHICFNGGPDRAKLILYDKTEIWLLSVIKGEVARVQKSLWTAPGSRAGLGNFLQLGRSPWIELLHTACSQLGVVATQDSFLGMGTFGRVFKVKQVEKQKMDKRQEEGFMALKLVLGGDGGERVFELLKEKDSLMSASKLLPHVVVHVKAFHDFDDQGAALLLSHVGEKISKSMWRDVFATLGMLHEANIVHGDSRLDNCILVDGSVRWIDFRSSAVVMDSSSLFPKRRDLETLLKSCFSESDVTNSSVIQGLVKQYDGTSSSACTIFDSLSTANAG